MDFSGSDDVIYENFEKIEVLMFTVFDDDEKIFDAIKAGASGYMLKHENAAVLEEAMINVLQY